MESLNELVNETCRNCGLFVVQNIKMKLDIHIIRKNIINRKTTNKH